MPIELSPEVLDAWQRAKMLRRKGSEQAAREANLAFDRLIGLRPWETSPLEADDGPCPWSPTAAGATSWHWAQALRRRLDAAAQDAKLSEGSRSSPK